MLSIFLDLWTIVSQRHARHFSTCASDELQGHSGGTSELRWRKSHIGVGSPQHPYRPLWNKANLIKNYRRFRERSSRFPISERYLVILRLRSRRRHRPPHSWGQVSGYLQQCGYPDLTLVSKRACLKLVELQFVNRKVCHYVVPYKVWGAGTH